jgi:hypothetical protein
MILQDLTQAQLIAKYEALQAQLKAANASRKLSFKVSEKGCVSVYGMNSRGVHLYATQWGKILDNAEAIRAFISANKELLSFKTETDRDSI